MQKLVDATKLAFYAPYAGLIFIFHKITHFFGKVGKILILLCIPLAALFSVAATIFLIKSPASFLVKADYFFHNFSMKEYGLTMFVVFIMAFIVFFYMGRGLDYLSDYMRFKNANVPQKYDRLRKAVDPSHVYYDRMEHLDGTLREEAEFNAWAKKRQKEKKVAKATVKKEKSFSPSAVMKMSEKEQMDLFRKSSNFKMIY